MSFNDVPTSSVTGSENTGSLSSDSVPSSMLTRSIECSTATTPSAPTCSPASSGSGSISSALQPAMSDQLEIALSVNQRECYNCRRILPAERFSRVLVRGSEFYHRRCNSCRAKRSEGSALMQAKRALVEKAKSGPCADCGRVFQPVCVDFDHVRGEKKFTLGQYRFRPLTDIEAEIAKCDVVCACCHRIRTSNRPEQKPGRPIKFLAEAERKSVKSRPERVALRLSAARLT